MSRFCQFTQKEFETFLKVGPDGKPLEKGGFYRSNHFPVHNTAELVYAKKIHPELSLRIYSTLEGGVARPKGTDAIRILVVWRPSEEEQRRWEREGLAIVDPRAPNKPIWPKIVGRDTFVLRVQGWRENLAKRLAACDEMIPPPHTCGCPTVWRTPHGNAKSPFWGCVWGRNCPAEKGTVQ